VVLSHLIKVVTKEYRQDVVGAQRRGLNEATDEKAEKEGIS
jgi:hypothetical protein